MHFLLRQIKKDVYLVPLSHKNLYFLFPQNLTKELKEAFLFKVKMLKKYKFLFRKIGSLISGPKNKIKRILSLLDQKLLFIFYF